MTASSGLPRLRALILDDYQGAALQMADWSRLAARVAVDVRRDHVTDDDDLIRALAPYDVVVAMRERTKFPRVILERLPNLQLLVTTGPHNAGIDVHACSELGITVCGTRGSSASTAELTWALILTAVRRLDIEIGNVRTGKWMTTLGTGLAGRTLGLLGLGRIGAQVAAGGQAFGMPIVAWSEHLSARRCAEVGATWVPREQLFDSADIVSVHLVLSDRTRGLVGEAELRQMKPSAWLVNTSRGPICDENALLHACQQRWIAGAALDVYHTEPLAPDHPFRHLDNVIATPHLGYVTEETYRTWFADVVEDIVAFVDGAPVRILADNVNSAQRRIS